MSEIRILHVDDEPDVRLLVEASLGLDPGLVTQSCASGAEALAIAAQWRPDLILLDATMPDMDGPATLTQLKHDPNTAGIPVLFLTASCQDSDVDSFKAMGSVGVIAKPFDPRALAPSVRSHAQQLAAETALAEPAASRLASPAGAAIPDTGPLTHAGAGPGTSMASGLGPAASATPSEASGIVPLDGASRAAVLPLGRDTSGSGSSWDWSAALDGHVGLLDVDPRAAGPGGASVPDPMTAGFGPDPMTAGFGPARSLFSGSYASGYDASSDLVDGHAWRGGDPLATGPGHDVWTANPSFPMLHDHKAVR